METQVRTPNTIFGQPQRFLVPLFQRPYVWNEEQQWEPLWKDLERVAVRLLDAPQTKQQPHFLGAVVLQSVQSRVGELQERTIIDGQQRLTTLQILLDALHAEIMQVGATAPAGRIEYLIQNDKRFCMHKEDRFKVWPTNRDRPAFNEVMAAVHPVKYESLTHESSRLAQAHQYFSAQARAWLAAEGADPQARAEAIERSARELLQLVVIDLGVDENAQEIFETLNARGAQLTAADLIKNFVFQKLLETGADVEKAYETYWKEFETAFWEEEVSAGRLRHQRSSLFINHWLVARTGEEIVAREVFSRFKRFAEHEAKVSMEALLQQMSRAAGVYRRITLDAENTEGSIDRIGLFSYRTDVMESDLMKAVLLALLDPEQPALPATVLSSTLDTIESWITRRMLVRATTKGYNQMVPEIVRRIRGAAPDQLAHSIRTFLAGQSAEHRHWPDDDELRSELNKMPIYRRVSRSRLRMVLEAVEDHRRGFTPGGKEYAGMRVPQHKYWIEHVMPQRWETSWSKPKDGDLEARARRIHSLGNLSLLTAKLNATVSNGPWLGETGKRSAMLNLDVLLMNRDLDNFTKDGWTDESIASRTKELIEKVISIWPVPEGHKVSTLHSTSTGKVSVDVADLLSAGLIAAGQVLVPRSANHREQTAQILPDGRIDVKGQIFDTPSGAGQAIRKRATNGWWFWLVDPKAKRSLSAVRRDYREKLSLPTDADDEDDEDEAETTSAFA